MSRSRVVGKPDVVLSRMLLAACVMVVLGLASCNSGRNGVVQANVQPSITVGVTAVTRKTLDRQITLSSELVPFQEIDVYAKESGYVRKLNVDYGSRVKAGQVMAVLEIPELQAQLEEDQAQIKNAVDEVTRAQHELSRYEAQYKALHLAYTRLNAVFETKPGIVAQQDVDNAQGQDLAAAAQVDAGQAALQAAQSHLAAAKAKLIHDQTLYDYSKITAPFPGVVTQRYANLGTLMQAGTGSSTQALPLVRLSQDDLFRLVIPVPESYVRYIRIGDPVTVRVPSLDKSFPGRVARFSVDVRADTRTMHTEVDVPNPQHVLMPGLYADAILALEQRDNALVVPVQALNHEGNNQTSVYVVTSERELKDQPVELGLTTANDAEVVSGLKEGDKVVVSDRSGLKSGQKVQPQLVQTMQYKEESTH
ncbi:MAG TPA: efflux RND transporter periplasmic adaptor subunit [Candidatus Bathyarchaeia archaeon]|nr:efflux RND transporter periplasmic adaptor subunit [Candidatus Bathyarchaeia archaeon]